MQCVRGGRHCAVHAPTSSLPTIIIIIIIIITWAAAAAASACQMITLTLTWTAAVMPHCWLMTSGQLQL